MLAPTDKSADEILAETVAEFYADPLGFVLFAFPWGEVGGPLEKHAGPDEWQVEFLTRLGEQVRERGFNGVDPVMAIRNAVSSGHGIGKSVMVAFVVLWAMSTRPFLQGTVTANTITQLETKTWPTIRTWLGRCITKHWFEMHSERLYRLGFKDRWFVAKQSSKEENSEAFAGQHAADSTSLYVFDEASAIPGKIWEVAEGGLTDGEPMFFAFGNATRNTGEFHNACFGSMRHRWSPTIIDSRVSRFTNKEQIAEWVTDHGEDSDFVRVRVRGLPPRASDIQFIGLDRVSGAQRREVVTFPDDPLVCGLDLARGGDDCCVFRFRRGLDARSIPAIEIPGEKARDSMLLVTKAADILSQSHGGQKVAAMFIDATGGSIGGPIGDRLRQLGFHNVIDVQFGGESPQRGLADMRTFMWHRLRDWLERGAIDTSSTLETDLTGPGYKHDNHDCIRLEAKDAMKKRGLASPDHGDALALTFAQVVNPAKPKPAPYRPSAPWA